MLIIKADTEKFRIVCVINTMAIQDKHLLAHVKEISEDVDFSPETLCVMRYSSLGREKRKMRVVFN